MPKRKNSDLDHISAQIKKLKKKLKRARNKSDSTSSSDTDTKEENDPSALLGLAEPSCEGENTAVTEDIVSDPDLNLNTQTVSDTTPDQSLVDLTSGEPPKEPEDSALDKDIMDILGIDPENKTQYGPEIHKEIASRLQHIATTGLTKETKKELQQKYLLPSNAVLLGAPQLNPEIKAALPDTLVSRDKALEAKQNLLGAAISCLATTMSDMLGSQNKDKDTLKKIMDGCRILCEIQHSDSITRRMFSMSVLKKDVKSQIQTSKIDKFLFGENLPETLKTAKAVSKSSAEIKINFSGSNKKPQSTPKTNLNARAPAAAGPSRLPPVITQRPRQPTSHQSQTMTQHRPSSQQQQQQQKNNSNYRRT